MAHKGTDYPLHFRRDFNVNRDTYQHGLPRAFWVSVGSLQGTLGDVAERYGYYCNQTTEVGGTPILWTCPVASDSGLQWSVRIEATFDNDRRDTVCRLIIFDTIGIALRHLLTPSVSLNRWLWGSASIPPTDNLETPRCTIARPSQVFIFCQAVGYNGKLFHGPPHLFVDIPIRPSGHIGTPDVGA